MKKFCFFLDEKTIVDLKLRLRHDGLSQTTFFKSVVDLYLNQPDKFVDSLEEIKLMSSTFTKTRIKKTMKLYKEGTSALHDFSLSEKEKKNVFDILEHELGDL